jgi:S1-C subfamily serine protease
MALPNAARAQAAADGAVPDGVDADAFFSAVVRIQTEALPDARSAETLGTEREGTGIVIGKNGLVLTIGYLIIEADSIAIIDDRGRSLPAKIVAYDHASGLGLVQSIVPFDVVPIKLGDSNTLKESDSVLVVNYGGRSEALEATVIARKPFTGGWEYLLDRAIFTTPPTMNWSGAGLISKDGALLGVGSLILRDAGDTHLPGNMFVPVEVLKPILADLIKSGKRPGPSRPWLGVNADEVQGRLVVARVSPDGPADIAGLQTGDIILAVAGQGVHSQEEFYRKVWGRGPAGSEISLRVLQGIDMRNIKVRSMDRNDYFRQRPTF